MSAIPGQRVAVYTEDGFYYLGTVAVLQRGGVGVDYDDGTAGFAPEGSYTPVEIKVKHEHPLTEEQLDGLAFDEEPTGEESKLAKLIGEPSLFRSARTPATKLQYLKRLHRRVNEWFFDGELSTPTIKLINDRGVRARLLGQWVPRQRLLKVGTRLFNAPEYYVDLVLTHEICHQAVTEIHRVSEGNGGHGPKWCAFMTKCGLTPSRYFSGSMMNFYKQDEIHEVAVKSELTEVLRQHRTQVWPRRGLVAIAVNAKTGEIEHGVIVCPVDKQGKRWAFYTGKSTTYRILAATEFYESNDHDLPSSWQGIIKAISDKYDK